MSALVPTGAVCMLYRRYLKAANNITNVTMRMMLIQQVRTSFRRHANVRSAAAQRELIVQSHKDLNILEDARLQRSLYINRLGMVSCVDWDTRQTEFHMDPRTTPYIALLLGILFCFINYLPFCLYTVEDKMPMSKVLVDKMADRLHGGDGSEMDKERIERERIEGMLSTSKRQRELQMSILTTFEDSPYVDAPKSNHKYNSIRSV